MHRSWAAIVGAATLGVFLCAAAGEPTTAPTTQAMYSIQGTVVIDAGFELQKPDLTRVVVYLDSDSVLDRMPHAALHPSVAQENKSFVPNFMVIPKGTDVEFPNWDHFSHNVFSRSAAAPPFDLDRYPYGQSKSRWFDHDGIIQVFCNIHPFMKAVIFVAPNAFAVRADSAGHFEISGVPPGQYQLCVWSERCQPVRQAVEVGASAASVTVEMHESRSSILTNDPPRRTESYGVARGLGVKREVLNLPVVRDSHAAPATETAGGPATMPATEPAGEPSAQEKQ
jgi:plastocyanin